MNEEQNVSHAPASCGVDELLNRLPHKTRAAILRLARRIADGYEGEIKLVVMKGGGIRTVEWVQREKGDEITEEIG